MPDFQYMYYGTKPKITFTPSTTTQSEGFESFPTVNSFFTVTNPSTMSGTTTGWQQSPTAWSGSFSISNQDLVDIEGTPQTARIDISFTIPSYARNIWIRYIYLQDCEERFDGLKVYLDGALVYDHIATGVYSIWTLSEITTAVTGTRTLTFEFFKDGLKSEGTDAVYIDDLQVSYDIDTIAEEPGEELVRFDGSTGYHLMYHRTGAQAPPVSLVEQRVPLQPGSVFQYMDIQPRDVELGIMVKGANPSDLRDKVRALTSKIINVDGALFARYSDGSERRLYCRYKQGLEGEETPSTMGAGYFQKMILIFHAFDPFWYSTGKCESQTAQNFIYYLNDGDYEAYPIVFVDGKCTNPDLAIWQTGGAGEPTEGSAERLKVNTTVAANRRLIINTKSRTVKLDDGTNLYASIDPTANKFHAIPPRSANNFAVDVDIDETEEDGRYHVYVETPYWGV
jgi:hypothetical protein